MVDTWGRRQGEALAPQIATEKKARGERKGVEDFLLVEKARRRKTLAVSSAQGGVVSNEEEEREW